MLNRLALRLYASVSVALVWAVAAAPASAQFRPRAMNEPVSGEDYHIEATAGLWWPSAEMSVSSSQFGIVGTTIDLKKDLGATDQRFPDLTLVLRPFQSHKFRLQLLPIQYTQSTIFTRDIVFNGQRYTVGVPVNSTVEWRVIRMGYEYDFVTKSRGYAGLILEAKYTDTTVNLTSPLINEYAHAQAPIPAIGGIGRYYVVPNISITAEVTGIKIPTVEGKYEGHYVDVDIFGTMNFTPNVGAQVGFRSMDFGLLWKTDTGSFTEKGLYIALVARY